MEGCVCEVSSSLAWCTTSVQRGLVTDGLCSLQLVHLLFVAFEFRCHPIPIKVQCLILSVLIHVDRHIGQIQGINQHTIHPFSTPQDKHTGKTSCWKNPINNELHRANPPGTGAGHIQLLCCQPPAGSSARRLQCS